MVKVRLFCWWSCVCCIVLLTFVFFCLVFCLFYELAMTTTKLPLVGWLKFFWIELNWIEHAQWRNNYFRVCKYNYDPLEQTRAQWHNQLFQSLEEGYRKSSHDSPHKYDGTGGVITGVTSGRGYRSGERRRVVDAVCVVSPALSGSVKVVVDGAEVAGTQLVFLVVRVFEQGVDLVLNNYSTMRCSTV